MIEELKPTSWDKERGVIRKYKISDPGQKMYNKVYMMDSGEMKIELYYTDDDSMVITKDRRGIDCHGLTFSKEEVSELSTVVFRAIEKTKW